MNTRKRTILTSLAAVTLMVGGGWTSTAQAHSPQRSSPSPVAAHSSSTGHLHVGSRSTDSRGNQVSFSFSIGNARPAPPPRPAPVVIHHPGHYETRWVPPVYGTRYDYRGRPYKVIVRPGYYERVWVPGTSTVHHPPRHRHPGHHAPPRSGPHRGRY